MVKKSISRKKKVIWIVVASVFILLLSHRIALPNILLRFVNRELTKIDGYTGKVEAQ